MDTQKSQIGLSAKLMQSVMTVLFIGSAVVLSPLSFANEGAEEARPNVIIMLIDDAALMDLGVYGGEAQTPNIDKLANSGVFFTQYRTTPLCAPSRAMLLTGLDNHQTGIATIPEILPSEHVDKPGYAMHLEDGVETLATHLRRVGYQTFMTGKWHLGSAAGQLPVAHGFDRSFILDASGADNWEQKSYMPYYLYAPWFEDDKPATLPDNFYSSEFIVDKMLTYLDEGDANKPFFALSTRSDQNVVGVDCSYNLD
jgi:arylsulfatase A-like enzyme